MRRQSLIGDGAIHLLAGHQALRYGVNTLNLEHPPLVKLLAALPLLAEPPVAPPLATLDPAAARELLYADPALAHRARLRAGALMTALFGLPFLGAGFVLGRLAGGAACGAVLALALGLSISVFPYLPTVQTDAAAGLGFVATAIAVLAYRRSPSVGRALAVGAAAGLAVAAKFSGILVLPFAAAAFFRGSVPAVRRARQALVAAAALAVVAAAPYAIANWRGDGAASWESIRAYSDGRASLLTDDRLLPWEESLQAIAAHSPALAQWATGLLGVEAQNALGAYPIYVAGSVSSRGRWWFFPLVLLVRTPLVLIAATVLAAVLGLRRGTPDGRSAERRPPGSRLVAAMVGLYLLAAMLSNYNLGIRHLLPVLPFLYLPAALWASRRTWRAVALLSCLALEAFLLTPSWMAATNTWWLGPHNPTRALFAAGDMDWGQGYIALQEAARERRIPELRVVALGLGRHELAAYLPDARLVAPGSALEPGWYALSASLERTANAILTAEPGAVRHLDRYRAAALAWQPTLKGLAAGEDHGDLAGTFHLLRLPAR